jgi:hypothetical protein
MFGTVFFIEAVLGICNWAVETVLSPLSTHIPHGVMVIVAAAASAVVIALTLRWLGGVSTKRLLMPEQVWFVVAGLLALAWVFALWTILGNGFDAVASLTGTTAGIAFAWRADFRRRRLPGQALPADSPSVD